MTTFRLQCAGARTSGHLLDLGLLDRCPRCLLQTSAIGQGQKRSAGEWVKSQTEIKWYTLRFFSCPSWSRLCSFTSSEGVSPGGTTGWQDLSKAAHVQLKVTLPFRKVAKGDGKLATLRYDNLIYTYVCIEVLIQGKKGKNPWWGHGEGDVQGCQTDLGQIRALKIGHATKTNWSTFPRVTWQFCSISVFAFAPKPDLKYRWHKLSSLCCGHVHCALCRAGTAGTELRRRPGAAPTGAPQVFRDWQSFCWFSEIIHSFNKYCETSEE